MRNAHLATATLCAAIAFTGSAMTAQAQRPDTRTMSCQQAVAVVQQYKAIVLSTGAHTYDRVVAGSAFCGPGQQGFLAIAPTIDNPRCRIGYVCREALNED